MLSAFSPLSFQPNLRVYCVVKCSKLVITSKINSFLTQAIQNFRKIWRNHQESSIQSQNVYLKDWCGSALRFSAQSSSSVRGHSLEVLKQIIVTWQNKCSKNRDAIRRMFTFLCLQTRPKNPQRWKIQGIFCDSSVTKVPTVGFATLILRHWECFSTCYLA